MRTGWRGLHHHPPFVVINRHIRTVARAELARLARDFRASHGGDGGGGGGGDVEDDARAALQPIFAMLDVDGDGELTRDELTRGLRLGGVALAPRDVDALVAHVDGDGDGPCRVVFWFGVL